MSAVITEDDITPSGPESGRGATGGHRPLRHRAAALVAVAVVLVGGLGVGLWLRAHYPGGSVVPRQDPAIEAKWGIRPVQVAVTGDEGFVDFRYIVLDPDKALNLMQDVNNLPVLKVESNGKIINSAAAMAAKHDLNAGRTYFFLYRNAEGAIAPGTRVTIQFPDGTSIQHVIAR